jgi:hypothetical protein
MRDRHFPSDAGWLDQCIQVPGRRTAGTKAQTCTITEPGCKGTLPAGIKE